MAKKTTEKSKWGPMGDPGHRSTYGTGGPKGPAAHRPKPKKGR